MVKQSNKTEIFKKYQSNVYLATLCAAWYLCSAIASNSGKEILNVSPHPVTLTYIHFFFVATLLKIYGLIFPERLDTSININQIKKVFYVSVNQVVGHVVTTYAVANAPISLVHTIKGVTPLFTVITCRILFETKYSKSIYISLIPLVTGVGLTSFKAQGLSSRGFFMALAASLTYTFGTIINKYALEKTKENVFESKNKQSNSKLRLLYLTSIISLCLMAPVWFYLEGYEFFSNSSKSALLVNDISKIGFGLFCLLNGITHTTQVFLATTLLNSTSPVTFSITSLFKRIFVITAGFVWFRQNLTLQQSIGVTIFFVGLFMYSRAKMPKGEFTFDKKSQSQKGH
ncbi:putative transporter [Zancudomyces culisetae]|uniref:Putative transporter n=1 Tax=Zancudomyces culisetae TaxID=1213189 RepID=A0A1R1PTL6_ZANCU|nr:putative transporter [Zancudomyces culisetae]|eukprot:OMH84336.1 putative transporter [Zancudomyces culisetae]